MKIEKNELRLRNRDLSAIAARLKTETGLAHTKVLDFIALALGFTGGNALMSRLKAEDEVDGDASPLSQREAFCLEQIARGGSISETAGAAGISERTVETHLKRARDAVGAKSTIHAAVIAAEDGWITVQR